MTTSVTNPTLTTYASKEHFLNHIAAGKLFNTLQLNLTKQCNLMCSHCIPKFVGIKRTPEQNPPSCMSLCIADSAICEAIEVVKANKNTTLEIIFFGGEPLLNQDVIFSVCRRYGKAIDGIALSYKIATNGTCVSDTAITLFSEQCFDVVVSLDGPEAEHNAVRCSHSTHDTFSLVMNSIKRMIGAGVNLAVSTLLNCSNFSKVDDSFLQFLKQSGVSVVTLLLPYGPVAQPFKQRFSPNEVADKLVELFLSGRNKGMKIDGYWLKPYQLKHPNHFSGSSFPDSTCMASGNMISVDTDGTLYNCAACSKSAGVISNFKDVFSDRNFLDYSLRAYAKPPACSDCILKEYCSGICFGHYDSTDTNINTPDAYYCDVFRLVTEALESAIAPVITH